MCVLWWIKISLYSYLMRIKRYEGGIEKQNSSHHVTMVDVYIYEYDPDPAKNWKKVFFCFWVVLSITISEIDRNHSWIYCNQDWRNLNK